MAIEQYLENTPVFTRAELMAACGEGQVNSTLLSKAKKTGKVFSVTRNVYVSNTGRYRAAEANPYLVAIKISNPAVFAYDTALGLLTGQQDVSFRISSYSNKARKSIEWNGREFTYYPLPANLQVRERRLADGTVIRFTSKEQTICDCLSHPDRCGGIETLLRSLATLEFIDSETLADIAVAGSKSLVAKVGWLLSQQKNDWSVPDETIDRLHQIIEGNGPFYFSKVHKTVEGGWNARWRLYFPGAIEDYERWLNE